MFETQYEALRRQGISRRSFLQFCSLTAASLGLGSAGAQEIAQAMKTKPRTPVVWLHGLECTCCTESFIRSYNPIAANMVMDLISLDYDDTIMAAAGHQAESALADTIEKYKGNYIVAVEGNIPLGQDGVFCIPGGETFLNKIKHVCHDAKAVIGWGSCAAWGCVQAAKPNPTKSVPITEVITDKPVVLVPGCPPIPEVMTAVITYIEGENRAGRAINLPDLAASFEAAVIDVQVAKAVTAVEETGVSDFCVGGGVAANPGLRAAYKKALEKRGVRVTVPPMRACGDNAAMIGIAALRSYNAGSFSPLTLDADPNAALGAWSTPDAPVPPTWE